MKRFPIEWQILEGIHHINCDFLTALFYMITQFGSSAIAIFILAIIYYGYNKDIAKNLGYICINSMLLNGILKSFFLAKRPFQYEGKEHLRVLDISKDGASGTSFPSGHSQNSGALYTTLIIFFKQKWIRIISALLIILVPFSRLYLGVHFPGDITIGLILGVLMSLLGVFLFNIFQKKHLSLYFLYGLSILIFLPFVIIYHNNPLVADFFKAYGLLIGFTLGCLLEERKVNFNYNVAWYYKLIRIIGGIAVTFAMEIGFKALFNLIPFGQNFFDLLRYLLMAFTAIGLVPLIFKSYEKEGQIDEK